MANSTESPQYSKKLYKIELMAKLRSCTIYCYAEHSPTTNYESEFETGAHTYVAELQFCAKVPSNVTGSY